MSEQSIERSSIRTRVAVSPILPSVENLGALRTIIYNYALTKSQGGECIFRCDDTDQRKHTKSNTISIEAQLSSMGVYFDYCPSTTFKGQSLYQSERGPIYKQYVNELLRKDWAIVEETGAIKVIPDRLKLKGELSIGWKDLILGEIKFPLDSMDNFYIVRSDGTPLFYLAEVADDCEMGIRYILSGQDKISSLKYQIALREMLDLPDIQYGHVPLMLSPNKTRLSSRDAYLGFSKLIEAGISKPAILSYICSSAYGNVDDCYSSIEYFASCFSVDKIHKHAAQIDYQRLLNINKRTLQSLSDEDFVNQCMPYLEHVISSPFFVNIPLEQITSLVLSVRQRVVNFQEVRAFFKYLEFPEYDSLQNETICDRIKIVAADLQEILDRKQMVPSLEIISEVSSMDRISIQKAVRWLVTGKIYGVDATFLLRIFQDPTVLANRIYYALTNL